MAALQLLRMEQPFFVVAPCPAPGKPHTPARSTEVSRLKGDRAGQYSIRINDQWRVCFEWRDGHAWRVEIVDYH
jgi:hypothetical protein